MTPQELTNKFPNKQYIEEIAEEMPKTIAWEIFKEILQSDFQRFFLIKLPNVTFFQRISEETSRAFT